MRFSIIFAVSFFAVASNAGEVDNNYLKCLVCRTTVKEVQQELAKVDPQRKIDIGNYRLDAAGNEIKKSVRMARSAVHISEVLDEICEKLSNYVRATYKQSGRLTLLNLMSPTGGMNPEISKVDIVQDGDLNKSLEYLCREVVADEEEEITEFFQKENNNNDTNDVCTNVCDESMIFEEPEDEETDDYLEKTEL